MQWLKSLLGLRDTADHLLTTEPSNPAQDALTAISHLSRAMKIQQGAVEICSALGNLYRLRGELDRAIQIRGAIIDRPDLDPVDRAQVFFELGRDYSRAGILDRARDAFTRCRELGSHTPALELELALLSAKSGDFLEASRQYHKIGLAPQAAHYLVRAASSKDGTMHPGLLQEAKEMYAASPEAWLESIVLLVQREAWVDLLSQLDQGLSAVGSDLAFLLLDPLLDHTETGTPSAALLPLDYLDTLLDMVNRQPQNLALLFYSGCLLRAHGRIEEAKTWQEKALLLNPSFWPARLELLTMSLPQQQMTPVFEMQLDFLLRRARQVKRFICSRCGLKRGQIFFCCPKCHSWHSIAFRQLITD